MPKKTDHRQARAALAKLAPETLQAVTVRMPAGLMIQVHDWAESKGRDLATAIREFILLGLDTANSSGATVIDPIATAKWQPQVEQALREGKSPLKPFLAHDVPSLDALPAILAKINYSDIFKQLKQGIPRVESMWRHLKDKAPGIVKELMGSLDELERKYKARKKEVCSAEPEEVPSVLVWLLSEPLLQQLQKVSPDEDMEEVAAVQKLIRARYLVPVPDEPWAYIWDD